MPATAARKDSVGLKNVLEGASKARRDPSAFNFINGRWQGSKSGETVANINPATGAVLGHWPVSTKNELDAAVAAAKKAFESWRLVPAPKRGEYLLRVHNLFLERKDVLARVMTQEMGKVLKETKGDVQEAVDVALYFASEGRRLFGHTSTSELENKFAMAVRIPVGVCGVISPWNFPMAIPAWKIIPALLCGNTVVFKPATDTPATATLFVEILEEAGLPPGVVNLIHGSGSGVGRWLVEHEDVRLISFTGSSDVGSRVAEGCAKTFKKVCLEMGGKNAQLVLDDANLDLAVDGALWGAFGTTGQRCTATSRLIVQEGIYKKFLDRLLERAANLRLGDGLNESTDVGPLVNADQLKTVEHYVAVGLKEDKAKLLSGGRRAAKGDLAKGYFHEPTIFEGTPGMRIAEEEIFGPVLTVLKVKNFDEGLKVLNATKYGLSGSVYTQDVNRVMRAIRDMETGITYINAPTIGAEAHMPFGGVKQTGNGHREVSWAALEVFTDWKAVYVDYSGRLQRAQIDTEG
ncbi:MAG: aldehyde dehydrogenase family protein [Elusimicrobia bacterium]|nr:aldehyde dehydrogenase family protein [Elusimicrobiota bacterium]